MTLAPAQLIFTNVEADLSPTRQRGFQVWLCSPSLTAEQRRAIAKRVDDYRLPPGTPPTPAAARHAYFRTADGLHVVARTVPLADRDKFGRGGKFHAHAAVFTEAAFDELGADPFRLIDNGFPFHSHPNEVAEEQRKTGEPPPIGACPEPAPGTAAAVPPDRLAELLAHVERGGDKPVVVAAPPEKVLEVLRACVRAFPPRVRKRLEFDTLSGGAFPAGVRYAVVGGFGADHLRTWAFRRYHKLDPAAWKLDPPLDKPTSALPGQLLAAPGWTTLTDADRDALHALAAALAGGKLAELPTASLSQAAGSVLAACPDFPQALKAATAERLRTDLPAALLAVDGVRPELERLFATDPSPVSQLARPLPRDAVAGGLLAAFGKPRGLAPPADAVTALGGWLDGGPADDRLKLIHRRWRGTADDLDALSARLLADDPTADWLRGWLPATLDPATLGGAAGLAGRLALDRKPDPAAVRDAGLVLALNGADGDAGGWEEVRLLAACHRGVDSLVAAIGKPPRKTAVEWLVDATADRLVKRAAPGWMSDGMDTTIGLIAPTGGGTAVTLLDVCERFGEKVARRVLHALCPLPEAGPRADDDVEPPAPKDIDRLYDKVLTAEPDRRRGAGRDLLDALEGASDEAYRWAANRLLQRVYGAAELRAVTADVAVVGLKLVWLEHDPRGALFQLFAAVAGAVASEVAAGELPEPGGRPGSGKARRFAWLLARLADPAKTERLRIH